MSTTAALYLLARQEFEVSHAAAIDALCSGNRIDWEAATRIGLSEGVAPIVAANLSTCARQGARIPKGVLERLDAALLENVGLKIQRRVQLAAGLRSLHNSGYDALLLKSAALEVNGVYREPWVTTSQDADMALRPARPLSSDERTVRWALYSNGVECDRFDHHDVTLQGVVRISFSALWSAATRVHLDGTFAWVPSPEDHLILLCVNACRKRYFRLKVLFDIAETVARQRLDWIAVAERARTFGCCGIVLAALIAAQNTVGLSGAVVGHIGGRARRAVMRLAVRTAQGVHERALLAGSGQALRRRIAADGLQFTSFGIAQTYRSLRATLFEPRPEPPPAVQPALPAREVR
jgi:hypothetical protein